MPKIELTRRRFLGAAAGAAAGAFGVAACSSGRPESRAFHQAIVVGSGYGGGVSALRLGEAGVDTLILERGRLWDTPDEDGTRFTKMLPADTRAGWFRDVPPSLVPSFRGISVDAVAAQNPGPSRSRPGSATR